ncbi:tRNA (N6-threonylcarbamoyladenosine(37)-N6)-methyltransferase TrmO [Absiella sp. AM29-15]|uniref:tRNA (N6-threonylcarbamoyladenosine(37)-N6)-methyltransferase TrmO n=1 Tax=Absiella sp. AM29-15 TaxID=2292278 RepID=UPI000E424897|nr:tRNA (N6-threonylcarbamoyladenosine(37)-N6)-methyltransferase TrmO [Absiella sp. AM29-15]RGC44905.1 tRNA (N6-threonylcarbamoyladenosine(37)-N6)-methyltransferase TrmO [Absiella sp. AM29-15]
MTTYKVNSIGVICNNEERVFIKLEPQFIPALKALEGFSHINVFWWFSDFDSEQFRSTLVTDQPYKNAPEQMGIFATRSPIRPNPIALTVVEVIKIDYQNGIIQIGYIDANDNTPLLDIKPYTPSLDRVEVPVVPEWCNHWPKSLEQSASFAWKNEFNF